MPRTPKAPKPSRPITPQKVQAVLRAHDLRPSLIDTTSNSPFINTIATHLRIHPDWGWDRHRGMVSWEAESARIVATLAAAGIAAEIRDGAVWVAVDQEQSSKPGD